MIEVTQVSKSKNELEVKVRGANETLLGPLLNRTLQDALDRRQPPNKAGKRFKLYYATQTKQAPPTFTLFVNAPEVYSDNYDKYLTRHMRNAFGYEGCPLRMLVKARPKSIQSVRRGKKGIESREQRAADSEK